MSLLAGLDLGTSSVKVAVMRPDGTVLARAQSEYSPRLGAAGEAEQSPDDWWHAAGTAVAATGLGARIDAVGLTGQMQDLILVAGDRALRPALLYSDTRAAAQHRRLRAALPRWEEACGNQQDATNVAAKIAWLAEHEPISLATAEHLLFSAAGYVAWRATGAAVCDVLTASTTGLLGVAERGWLRHVATAAGAQPTQLPRLIDGADALVGEVSPEAARQLGVRAGIPVVLAMGDAGTATAGLVGSAPGQGYLYLGTTGWFAAVTPAAGTAPTPIHQLVMPGWANRLRIGAVQSAGSAADWARRAFFPGLEFADVEALVGGRVSDADALAARPLCLPGLAGERAPVRGAEYRGAFVGVTPATGPAELYLAVLTGVALGLRHVADELGVAQRRIPLVGGAAGSAAWRQILADVFDATIETRPQGDPETHAAVMAAADALGLKHELRPLFADAGETTRPSALRGRYAQLVVAHRELYDALSPTFARLAGAGEDG